MQKLLLVAIFLIGLCSGVLLNQQLIKFALPANNENKNPDRPLDKYTIDNLANREIAPGKIVIKEMLSDEGTYKSYLFEFEFNPNIDNRTLKKTTGMINVRSVEGGAPSRRPLGIIIMIRGFVDQKLYLTGMGTKNVANYFADNGFITIAPDFLGYGESDSEAEDIFESRFQTYVTILSLLRTVEAASGQPDIISAPTELIQLLTTNNPQLFLWSHSNGGQIALTVLEIIGRKYPTVLWTPITKPFPYSVLYYTDEADDRGKFLRSKLSEFEKIYDTDLFSLTNYIDRIKAPIQINQGTYDAEVPRVWSDEFVNVLKEKNKEVEYLVYQAADHNMRPSWDEVVINNLNFFNRHLNVVFDNGN